jgi:prefoldin subunit 5
MKNRTIELDRLRAELQLWDAEMTHLEAKVDSMAPESRSALQNESRDTLEAMLHEELARLRQLWSEAAQSLDRLERTNGDEWKIVLERAELNLSRLGAAFEQSRSRFGE